MASDQSNSVSLTLPVLMPATQEIPLAGTEKDNTAPGVAISASVDQYPVGWRLGILILPLCLGILLVAIDNTIIGVATPKISTEFVALGDVGWYASAYLLTETSLQPTLGSFYKYFNVKFCYLISIVVFEGMLPDLPLELGSLLNNDGSWLDPLRRSTKFANFYPGPGNRWSWSCWYLSRSSLHRWARCTT